MHPHRIDASEHARVRAAVPMRSMGEFLAPAAPEHPRYTSLLHARAVCRS